MKLKKQKQYRYLKKDTRYLKKGKKIPSPNKIKNPYKPKR